MAIPHAEATHHAVLSAKRAGHERGIEDVASHDGDRRQRIGRPTVAYYGGHAVPVGRRELDEVASAVSACAEDDEVHSVIEDWRADGKSLCHPYNALGSNRSQATNAVMQSN